MDLTPIISEGLRVLPSYFGPDARSALELCPAPDVYRRVFDASVVDAARAAYTRLWTEIPNLPVPPIDTSPLVNAAMAEDFTVGGPRTRPFANGYREIGAKLIPGVAWLVLRFVKPGSTIGLAFDGFVYLEPGNFAWFPKPWKMLAPAGAIWSHWSE